MWNIKTKHFPHIPIPTQWWKAAVIWFNQTTFKAGGSEHCLSQAPAPSPHTAVISPHTRGLFNCTWRTRKNVFCGQNWIPTFLVKKHKEHLTEKTCLREAANAKDYLEIKIFIYIERRLVWSLPSKANQMGSLWLLRLYLRKCRLSFFKESSRLLHVYTHIHIYWFTSHFSLQI